MSLFYSGKLTDSYKMMTLETPFINRFTEDVTISAFKWFSLFLCII